MTTLSQAHMLRRIAKLLDCDPAEVEQRVVDMLDEQRVVGEIEWQEQYEREHGTAS